MCSHEQFSRQVRYSFCPLCFLQRHWVFTIINSSCWIMKSGTRILGKSHLVVKLATCIFIPIIPLGCFCHCQVVTSAHTFKMQRIWPTNVFIMMMLTRIHNFIEQLIVACTILQRATMIMHSGWKDGTLDPNKLLFPSSITWYPKLNPQEICPGTAT